MRLLQKITNRLAYFFLMFRYRNKKDPFKNFREIIGKTRHSIAPSDTSHKKRLLLVPFRVAPVSNLFEGLIGYFYKLKGHKVAAILCDQGVAYCDHINYANEKKREIICALCLKEQKRFCKTFGFEEISIKKSITESERKKIHKDIRASEIKSFENLEYQGVDITRAISSAVTRYTLRSEIDFEKDKKIINGFLTTAHIILRALEEEVNNETIGKAIMSHGVYSTWGTILAFLKERQIPTYVWARGYVGQGNLIFGHNKSYLEDAITEDKHYYQSYNLTPENRQSVLDFYASKQKPASKVEYVNYYSVVPHGESDPNKSLDNIIGMSKRVFGMFTNIPWDGQIYNRTKGFPSTAFYLETVLDWFKLNKDCLLIIRAHPAELDKVHGYGAEKFSDVLKRVCPVLPTNVVFIKADSEITSYHVAKRMTAGIVYGSSIGIELAVAGIPVIQAGRFNTTGKDIVFEAPSKAEMYRFLNLAKNDALRMSAEQKENAIKFGHYWLYRRHVPDTSLEIKRLVFEKYNFNNLDEFKKDSTMNLVYQHIEADERILATNK